MKITVKGKQYDSGKMLFDKYDVYTKARNELAEKVLFNSEDINLMIDTLVFIFDDKFTAKDIKSEMDISDIIFNFSSIDIEISGKVNNKALKASEGFTKGKKFKR
ncbi:MAG: hypothetical protein E6343_08830 [Clostridium perfringens]|nr:hypothetical protein [Clostridium perfringens]